MYLLGPATVCTGNLQGACISAGGVLIHGDKVMAVGSFDRLADRFAFVDRKAPGGDLIMPGLVDARWRLAQPHQPFPEGAGADSVHRAYFGALRGAMAAAHAGVTSLFHAVTAVTAADDVLDQVAWAFSQVGLRSCIGYSVSDRLGAEAVAQGLAENLRFQAAAAGDDRLRAWVALELHGQPPDWWLADVAGTVAEAGLGLQIDLSPERHDDVIPQLDRFGLLGADTVMGPVIAEDLAHARLLQERKVTVVSGLDGVRGWGWPPLLGFWALGGQVAFGSKGFSPTLRDAWASALVGQGERHGQSPQVLAQSLTDVLLRGNAMLASRCFGVPLGRLEAGAAADLVILRTAGLASEPQSWALQGTPPDQVQGVMVGGRYIVQDGHILGLDEERVAAQLARGT